MKVLVTGANGFIGQAVLLRLNEMINVTAVGSVRRSAMVSDANAQLVMTGELSAQTDWSETLVGVQVVIHTAARVHIIREAALNPLEEFRRINVQGTLNLARQAAGVGVRRFVFLSSIGVNGAETFDKPFTDQDLVAPHSPYAVSKYETELGLQALAEETGMEVVIIRPPLVYGLDAPGNFGSLIRWLRRGVPLPLGAVHNQRSLVSLDNLVDFIVKCVTHPAAANHTFLVSDGEDVSTTDLLRRIGKALGKQPRLLAIPMSLLKLVAALLGKSDVAKSLCGSLQVDIKKNQRLLGWTPPQSVDDGLLRALGNAESPHSVCDEQE